MTIGIISDTHGYLDPKVRSYFDSCDEIWHAGDIGTLAVLEELESIRPTFGVYGNVDGQDVRLRWPKDLWLNRSGVRILITHIAGRPGRYNKRVKFMLEPSPPDVLICGHSHMLKVMKDAEFNNMLYINPGAAGKQGFHHIKTMVRMTLEEGKVTNLEVVEMGKRGSI
jgi:putative phosphoesterase